MFRIDDDDDPQDIYQWKNINEEFCNRNTVLKAYNENFFIQDEEMKEMLSIQNFTSDKKDKSEKIFLQSL